MIVCLGSNIYLLFILSVVWFTGYATVIEPSAAILGIEILISSSATVGMFYALKREGDRS